MKELKFEDSCENGIKWHKLSECHPQQDHDVLVYQDLYEDGYDNPFVAMYDTLEHEWLIHHHIGHPVKTTYMRIITPIKDSDVWTYLTVDGLGVPNG